MTSAICDGGHEVQFLYLKRCEISPDQGIVTVFSPGVPEQVQDVGRLKNAEFSLDKQGYRWLKWSTGLTRSEFDDPAIVSTRYRAEVECLLRENVDRVTEVHIYDFRKRDAICDDTPGPALYAHIDTDPIAVLDRMHTLFGAEKTEALKSSRIQVFNVWRSIGSAPIVDFPLALCDASTLDEGTLVSMTLSPDRQDLQKTSVLYAKPGRNRRWFYKDGMNDTDVVIFKQDDNADVLGNDVLGKRVLHSSFKKPEYHGGGPFRESMECRALVISSI